jgi:3-hydroxymyristoyl/3-hydroxydecanoyl-(acyl carrier protein) dehydratase
MTQPLPEMTLRSQTAKEVVLELVLHADMPCFDGHFPGAPVLPGVVQLDWAVRLCQRYFDECQLHSSEALKFIKLSQPGDKLRLTLTRTKPGAISFVFTLAGENSASGRLKWE